MDVTFWLMFIIVSILFSTILALLIKFIFGKYFMFFVPIPTSFLMLFILISMIALQGFGVRISEFYAWFFYELSKLLKNGGIAW